MANVQPSDIGFGTIFKYQEPVTSKVLEGWADDHGYDRFPQGAFFQINDLPTEIPTNIFAQDNGFQILYNPTANISGIGSCSYITVKNSDGEGVNRLESDTEDIWQWFSDIGIQDDIVVCELTYSGSIRVPSHDLSDFFNRSHFDAFAEISDADATGMRVDFVADQNSGESGWWRLRLVRGEENVKLWDYQWAHRLSNPNEIDLDKDRDFIESFVDRVKENNDEH